MVDSRKYDNDEPIFEMRPDNSFLANSKGIIEKKAEFLGESEEFLLLRKGEDVGADIIACLAITVNALSDISLLDEAKEFLVYAAVMDRISSFYRRIKAIIDKKRKIASEGGRGPIKPKDLRILCWPDSENRESKPMYENQGYFVRRYKSEGQKGPLRYYLNEKRYCIFMRTGEDEFTGVIGNSKETISELRKAFEDEWKTSVEF